MASANVDSRSHLPAVGKPRRVSRCPHRLSHHCCFSGQGNGDLLRPLSKALEGSRQVVSRQQPIEAGPVCHFPFGVSYASRPCDEKDDGGRLMSVCDSGPQVVSSSRCDDQAFKMKVELANNFRAPLGRHRHRCRGHHKRTTRAQVDNLMNQEKEQDAKLANRNEPKKMFKDSPVIQTTTTNNVNSRKTHNPQHQKHLIKSLIRHLAIISSIIIIISSSGVAATNHPSSGPASDETKTSTLKPGDHNHRLEEPVSNRTDVATTNSNVNNNDNNDTRNYNFEEDELQSEKEARLFQVAAQLMSQTGNQELASSPSSQRPSVAATDLQTTRDDDQLELATINSVTELTSASQTSGDDLSEWKQPLTTTTTTDSTTVAATDRVQTDGSELKAVVSSDEVAAAPQTSSSSTTSTTVAPTTSPPNDETQTSAELSPELLLDHTDHESDKLSHLNYQQQQQQSSRNHQARFKEHPDERQVIKLDTSGWLPSPRETHQTKPRGSKPEKSKPVSLKQQQQQQQVPTKPSQELQKPVARMRPHPAKSLNRQAARLNGKQPGGRIAEQPRQASSSSSELFSSSLSPKHIPPPEPIHPGTTQRPQQAPVAGSSFVWAPDHHWLGQQQQQQQFALNPAFNSSATLLVDEEGGLRPGAFRFPKSSRHLVALQKLRPSGLIKAAANQQHLAHEQAKGPFKTTGLKAKGPLSGLLPRLAAKLFQSQASSSSTSQHDQDGLANGLSDELLSQQQSHLFATHNSPGLHFARFKHAPSSASSLVGLPMKVVAQSGAGADLAEQSSSLFPGGSLVKSLFGSAGQSVGSKQPASKLVGSQQKQQLNQATMPKSSLILMNGQVYSVLQGDPSPVSGHGSHLNQASGGSGNPGPNSIFDHQTSDTSDFPIFEAISQATSQFAAAGSANQMPLRSTNYYGTSPVGASTWSPIQQAMGSSGAGSYGDQTMTSSNSAQRCDRPRHIIQADRTVVNHILASEQNFVIARVPIKKYARQQQQQPTMPPSWASASNGFAYNSMNGYSPTMAPQQAMFAAPQQQQQQFVAFPQQAFQPGGYLVASGTGGRPTTIQYQSSAPTTTIELSTGHTRPGLFQSIAQLIGNLRRRPASSIQTVTSGSMAAGSMPMGVFAGQPSESITNGLGVGSGLGGAGLGSLGGLGQASAILTLDGPIILASARDDPASYASYFNASLERLHKLRQLLVAPSKLWWQQQRPSSLKKTRKRSSDSQLDALDTQHQPVIIDHSALAASIISQQLSEPLLGAEAVGSSSPFVAASQPNPHHQLQLNPMRRLLMLKTSSENEVCSPIGEQGLKIKYSCVPNSCVVTALANAARGLGMGTSVHQNQHQYQTMGAPSSQNNNHQLYSTTNRLYKMSNSMEYPNSERYSEGSMGGTPYLGGGGGTLVTTMNPLNLQPPSGITSVPVQVQVHQFDESQQNQNHIQMHQGAAPPVRVTYTHLNAYQQPPISKLVQPQHQQQQFVSSSQVLNELANTNNELDPADRVAYSTNAQFQNHRRQRGAQQPQQQQVVMVDGGGLHSTSNSNNNNNNNNNVVNQPAVTFGTAYIRTSPTPVTGIVHHLKTSARPDRLRTSSYSASSVGDPQDQFQADEGDDDNGGSGPDSNSAGLDSTGVYEGPNEFLSAVEEQLERPIRLVTNAGKSKQRAASGKKGRAPSLHHKRQQQAEQRKQVVVGGVGVEVGVGGAGLIENGGSSAENAPIENAMTHRDRQHHREQQQRPFEIIGDADRTVAQMPLADQHQQQHQSAAHLNEPMNLYHVSENRKQRRLAPSPSPGPVAVQVQHQTTQSSLAGGWPGTQLTPSPLPMKTSQQLGAYINNQVVRGPQVGGQQQQDEPDDDDDGSEQTDFESGPPSDEDEEELGDGPGQFGHEPIMTTNAPEDITRAIPVLPRANNADAKPAPMQSNRTTGATDSIPDNSQVAQQQQSLSKFRRDNGGLGSTSNGQPTAYWPSSGYRYGQRQPATLRPLPPPEKTVDISLDSLANQLDDSDQPPLGGTGTTSSPPPSSTTECDCSTPASLTTATPDSFSSSELTAPPPNAELEPREKLQASARGQQQFSFGSGGSSTTTLRPGTGARQSPGVSSTTTSVPQRQVATLGLIRSANGTSASQRAPSSSSGLAKDRRQTQASGLNHNRPFGYGPSVADGAGSGQFSANGRQRTAYNLRNTTYKNLLLTNNNELRATLLSPPEVGSHTERAEPQVDLTTSTPGSPKSNRHDDGSVGDDDGRSGSGTGSGGGPASPPGANPSPNEQINHSELAIGNNLTHFDDSNEVPQQQPPPPQLSPSRDGRNNGHDNHHHQQNDNHRAMTDNEFIWPTDQVASVADDHTTALHSKRPARLVSIKSKRVKWRKQQGQFPEAKNGTADDEEAPFWTTQAPTTLPVLTQESGRPIGGQTVLLQAPGSASNATGLPVAGYKPASVNDILAQAKGEPTTTIASVIMNPKLSGTQSQLLKSLDERAGNLTSRNGDGGQKTAESRPAEHNTHLKSKSGVKPQDYDDLDDDDDDQKQKQNEEIPHQYQIQLRWNEMGAQQIPPPPPSLAASSRNREQILPAHRDPTALPPRGNVDKLGERVRDRLFEHREEEHWHERAWLKANQKASNGDPNKPAGLVDPHKLDYGPHERETPVRDQLGHAPSADEVHKHFAIPTRNFGQSQEFVEWAQRDVDLNEWPDQPKKREPNSHQLKSTATTATRPDERGRTRPDRDKGDPD